jgi:protein-tyrosine-phosphatase
MADSKLKILFLCTGNSARSIFAEFLTKKICPERFEPFSAGSAPAGAVNPYTLRVLRDYYNLDVQSARSKSWDEFKDISFDIVLTVCDRAKQSCPIFPGQPTIAHWSIPDPAEASGTDEQKLRAFKETALLIQRRIELLCSFPPEKLRHLLAQPIETPAFNKLQ